MQGRCPICTLRPPCKHINYPPTRLINSQRDAEYTSHQFASISSDIKAAGPTSVNPKQLSDLQQDSLFGQSLQQAVAPESQHRRSSVASLSKGGGSVAQGSKFLINASMASTFQASSSH